MLFLILAFLVVLPAMAQPAVHGGVLIAPITGDDLIRNGWNTGGGGFFELGTPIMDGRAHVFIGTTVTRFSSKEQFEDQSGGALGVVGIGGGARLATPPDKKYGYFAQASLGVHRMRISAIDTSLGRLGGASETSAGIEVGGGGLVRLSRKVALTGGPHFTYLLGGDTLKLRILPIRLGVLVR